jgi:hypothetical protein
MEAENSSETLAYFYQTTWRHIQEDFLQSPLKKGKVVSVLN